MGERARLTTKTPEAKKNNHVFPTRKPDFSQSTGSPINHILFLQRTIGNQAVLRMLNNSAESKEQSAKSREQRAGNEGHGVQGQRLCTKRIAPCTVHAKLTIGQPNDVYEQEADRVAEQVMRVSEPASPTLQLQRNNSRVCPEGATCPTGFQLIDRATWFHCGERGARTLACAVCTSESRRDCNCNNIVRALGHSNIIAPLRIGGCGDIFEITTPGRTDPPLEVTLAERPGGTPLDIHQDVIPQLGLNIDRGRYCVCLRRTDRHDNRVIRCGTARCTPVVEQEEETLHAKEIPDVIPKVTPTLESRLNAIRDGGQPLPESVCNYFEPRFGYDFRHVRVHADSHAAESAKAVNAKAYTIGQDVVFGTGQYSPRTTEGRRLLAHELTHVVQQNGKNNNFSQSQSITPENLGDYIQRWKISGNRVVSDDNSDTLWGLARRITGRGYNWPCIRPVTMKSPRATGADYPYFVVKGDEFDISNLTVTTGPSLRLHLFGVGRDAALAVSMYATSPATEVDIDIDRLCENSKS